MDKENKNTSNTFNILTNIENNIQFLKDKFKGCSDIIYRTVNLDDTKMYIIYIEGLIDKKLLMEEVLEKIFCCESFVRSTNSSIEKIANELPITEMKLIDNLNSASYELLNGNILVFVDNNTKALVISLNKYSNSEEPFIEPTILGPKERFTKVLNNNKALVRRYLNNEDLKISNSTLGKTFPKQASVLYLDSIVNKQILDEVFRRINNIDLDIVLDASNLAEFIEDSNYSPFPTITVTERIDKVIANLIEGKIVILLDNSTFALILPSIFINFFHSPEDYYNRFFLSSFIRMLRWIAYFISIFLPGFYIAVTLFNQELVPTKLLMSIATQAIDTPFSSTSQLIIMLIAFELLRELGIRLPKGIGSTVSIVGALIIGETVVRAGLVSTSVVIITAFTAISSMVLPTIQLYESILISRIICLFFSSTLGFWGIIISFLFLSAHLSCIYSFGIPYTRTLISNSKDMDDVISRPPLWVKNKKQLFKIKNKL